MYQEIQRPWKVLMPSCPGVNWSRGKILSRVIQSCQWEESLVVHYEWSPGSSGSRLRDSWWRDIQNNSIALGPSVCDLCSGDTLRICTSFCLPPARQNKGQLLWSLLAPQRGREDWVSPLSGSCRTLYTSFLQHQLRRSSPKSRSPASRLTTPGRRTLPSEVSPGLSVWSTVVP